MSECDGEGLPSDDVATIIETQTLIGACHDLLKKAVKGTESDAVRAPLRKADDNLKKASEQLGNVLEATR